MKRRLFSVFIGSLFFVTLSAQTIRSAYHVDGFVFGHELNPAFQPESNYFSLPVLGNSSMYVASSLKLSDLLYDTSDGKLTTFMSRGTIEKGKLLDMVGDGWQQSAGGDLTLASWGRRLNKERYQTLSLSMHGEENLILGREYFNLLKDIENGTYNLADARFDINSYLSIAAGESRRLNDHWTVGIKAKLLLGLVNIRLRIDDLQASLSDEKWSAQGNLYLHSAGADFRSEKREYNALEHAGETYNMVTGFDLNVCGVHGLGLGVDAGVNYRKDEHWSFSASLLDLGFITWYGNKKAVNGGEPFEFGGFSDACLDEPDEYDNPEVYRPNQSIGNQLDLLKDDFIDLVHLESRGRCVRTSAIGATTHIAATYKMPGWTFGALATARIQGQYSWYECRLSGVYQVCDGLDVSLSPNYSTFGWGMGGIISYRTSGGHILYLGSDHLVLKTNKQFIPISLNGSISAGMSFPLK